MGNGRMQGAPYRGHGCVPLRFGGVWLGGGRRYVNGNTTTTKAMGIIRFWIKCRIKLVKQLLNLFEFFAGNSTNRC